MSDASDGQDPVDLLDVRQFVADVDQIRGAYGFLLMRLAVTDGPEDTFAVCKKEEAANREAFARLEELLSRPGFSNHESWDALVERLRSRVGTPSPSEWLEISTAPERRKVIVAWVNSHGKTRQTYASFWPVGTLNMGDDVSEDAVDENGKNTHAGWWEESEANDDDMWRLTEPLTHWHALIPSPPSAGVPPHPSEKA